MAQPREQPWAEHEKVYLLAEIIKAAPLSSNFLFNLIKDRQIQPKWTEIALPQGRSLRSCQVAYQEILNTYTTAEPRQPATASYHPPPVRYPVQSPSDVAQKRPLPSELSTPTGRLIQPRPPHTYPLHQEHYGGQPYALAPMGEPPHKKKRGRPTKAEAQARADAALARGEIYPPPSRRKPPRQTTGSEDRGQSLDEPGSSGAPPGVPDPAVTPQTAPAELGSESSSGKKRRGRPARLDLGRPTDEGEPESPLQTAPARSGPSQQYLQPAPADAPSSAPLEHRERDIRIGGGEDYHQHHQKQLQQQHTHTHPHPHPHPQQQQHQLQQQQQQLQLQPQSQSQPQPQSQSQPQQHQTTTSRSFKETVGM